MQLTGVATKILTKKVPVIFHNLRVYDGHLIFYELKKFDVKIDVIPSRLEKYMAYILNKNLYSLLIVCNKLVIMVKNYMVT